MSTVGAGGNIRFQELVQRIPSLSSSFLLLRLFLLDLDDDFGVGRTFSSSSSSLEFSGVMSSPFSSNSLALVQMDCSRIESSNIYNKDNYIGRPRADVTNEQPPK